MRIWWKSVHSFKSCRPDNLDRRSGQTDRRTPLTTVLLERKAKRHNGKIRETHKMLVNSLYWPSIENECLGDEKFGSCVGFDDGVTQDESRRLPSSRCLLLLLLPCQLRRDGERWSGSDDDGISHVVGSVDTRARQIAPRTASYERRKRTASLRPAESICADNYESAFNGPSANHSLNRSLYSDWRIQN